MPTPTKGIWGSCRQTNSFKPFVAERREILQRQLLHWDRIERADRILGSREYAFCLFPEAMLTQTLLDS